MRKKGSQRIYLVLEAADTSENTNKKLNDKCAFYQVPLVETAFDGEALGNAVGKHSKVAAVAITDEQLCRLVEKTINKD